MIFDSLAASLGEGLLAYYAAQNREKGMSIDDNYQWLLDHRLNTAHWFTAVSYTHLGGLIISLSLKAYATTLLMHIYFLKLWVLITAR